MAITNNLKVFADTLTSASETEFQNGVSAGGYIYADTLNTALRTGTLVAYALMEVIKDKPTGAYTIGAASTSTDVVKAIKAGLNAMIVNTKVANASKADSATTATSAGTATTATSANTAKVASKLAEGVGSATEPVYVDTDGTVKKCTGINVPGSVTSATNASNVTSTIAGKNIIDMFDVEGNARNALNANEATNASNVTTTIGGVKLTDIFEYTTSSTMTKRVQESLFTSYINAYLYLNLNGKQYSYHGGRTTDENVTVTFYAPTTLGTKNYLVCVGDDGLTYVNPTTLTVENARYADEAGMASSTEQPLRIYVGKTLYSFNGSDTTTVKAGNVVPYKGGINTLTKTTTRTGNLHIDLMDDQEFQNTIETTLLELSETMSLSSSNTPSFEIKVTYTPSGGEETEQTLYRKMSDIQGTIGALAKVYNYDGNARLELLNCSVDENGDVIPSVMYNKVAYIEITLPSTTNVNTGSWEFQLVGTQYAEDALYD